MKIHILSFGNPEVSGKATGTDLLLLSEAAKKLGHQVEVIFDRECQLRFTSRRPEILVKGKKTKIDVLLVRANFLREDVEFKCDVIKQFQMAGVRVINKRVAVLRAKNKLRTMQILSKKGLPIPKTYFIRSAEYLERVIKDIGSFPVILKTISGSHGSGVSIIESQRGLKSLLDLLVNSQRSTPLMIQEYIREASGKDMRVFIVGSRIVGAMERLATKKGEFRSNFHLGGRVRVAEMTEAEKRAAFAAVRACGLQIAGVDILRTKKGPKILEVNCNPGLEGITQATGRDIAAEIIKYAVKKGKH
ncbi:MAG TPA: RimK family alpha-L-glutamate ligase [Patescibacteria group bacterium]|nr:RimK family alpha-L-glutamate ligase [Patescibacteria group bacterium]